MTDTIGGRIEAALAEKNMTRKELVEKSGINKGTLSKYISNKNIPSISNILKISEGLNIKTSWLSGFEKKDSCNSYKKENMYELYEICPCEFYACNAHSEIILMRHDELTRNYEKNNCSDNVEFEKNREGLEYLRDKDKGACGKK